MPKGTAYQSDLGMCVPCTASSASTPHRDPALPQRPPDRFEVGPARRLQRLQIDVDPANGRALAIERIQRIVRLACRAILAASGIEGPPAGGHMASRRAAASVACDLHTHSRRSDGVLEPLELVTVAPPPACRCWPCPTDTLAGARELTAPAGRRCLWSCFGGRDQQRGDGIARLWEGELHILGLGVDLHDEAFEATLERQRGFG